MEGIYGCGIGSGSIVKLTREQASEASIAYGGVENLVSGTVPSWSCYTLGEINGHTCRLHYAEAFAAPHEVGWWAVFY